MKPTYEEILTALKNLVYSRNTEYNGHDDFGNCIHCGKVVMIHCNHLDDCPLKQAEDLLKRINEN